MSIIIALAAAAGLLVVLALGVWIMSMRSAETTSKLSCVTGEAATNPVNESGIEQERGALFGTIAEAEAFICQDVPQIQQPGDWHLIYALAKRTHSLQDYRGPEPPADASRYVSATYSKAQGTDLYATLTFTTTQVTDPAYANCMMEEGELSNLVVHGNDATLWESKNAGYEGAILCWQHGSLLYRCDLVVHDKATNLKRDVLPRVLTILDSIE